MVLAHVLVAEDDAFTRLLLTTSLSGMHFRVIPCITAKAALEAVAAHPVDVALLDIDLGPGPSGVDVANALRQRKHDLGIVFLTTLSDPRLISSRHPVWPRGSKFLRKSELHELEQLRDVLLLARSQPLQATVHESPNMLSITSHQLEILRLIADGFSNPEIAKHLGISVKAVEAVITKLTKALKIRRDGNARVLLARAYAQMAGKEIPHV